MYQLDVDECANNNGGCSQMCMNSDGSFKCECRSGYQLDRNGITCNGESSSLINRTCMALVWSLLSRVSITNGDYML